MRILFLAKRRPMGRDLIERPYGRFFHLPRLMAAAGHDVTVLLLSYRYEPSLDLWRDGVRWISSSLWPVGPARFWWRARGLARRMRPDWVVGLSDTYFGILAVDLARSCCSRAAIDAYDNYEAYLPNFTWLHRLWRRALRRADVLTAAGPQLAQLMAADRPDAAHVVPMAADPVGFAPLDRDACRRSLGLDTKKRYVGYCGSVHRNRGIETLFEAIEVVNEHRSDVCLLLSGRLQRGINLPDDAMWLGAVPDADVPKLLNSLDLLAVINRKSSFGNYSYPVKLCEAMACGIPLVASATGPVEWMLSNQSELLVAPGDAAALASKILVHLDDGRVDYGRRYSWEESVDAFISALESGSAFTAGPGR